MRMSRNATGTTLSGEPARFAGGLHDVGSGVYAWLQPNGGLGEANAGLIVGDGESAVIDTLWDHRQAARMNQAMRVYTDAAPVHYVVNTHSNGDHWWGNAVMPADASIITSQATLAAMGRESPRELQVIQAVLRAGAWLPGSVGTDCRYGASRFAPFRFGEVRLRRPDTTFIGRSSRNVGGRLVELIEVGPAHTPGDLIVNVPDASIVFTGDILFVGVTPIMWDGPVANWINAIDTITSLNPATVVPGHGPLATPTDLTALRDYWSWVEAGATEHHRNGLTAYQAAVTMLESQQFATSPWARWDTPELLVGNVAAVYRNLDGVTAELSPLATVQVFASIARLARHMAGRR
jgi:glyoxylase-like metal-dependent hydrolase (beta-lactamase superfamily II)